MRALLLKKIMNLSVCRIEVVEISEYLSNYHLPGFCTGCSGVGLVLD